MVASLQEWINCTIKHITQMTGLSSKIYTETTSIVLKLQDVGLEVYHCNIVEMIN